jgi:hypothetical protein
MRIQSCGVLTSLFGSDATKHFGISFLIPLQYLYTLGPKKLLKNRSRQLQALHRFDCTDSSRALLIFKQSQLSKPVACLICHEHPGCAIVAYNAALCGNSLALVNNIQAITCIALDDDVTASSELDLLKLRSNSSKLSLVQACEKRDV